MDNSKIEWTDASWNPLRARAGGRPGWACQRVSPGCEHCYAETINRRLGTGELYDAIGILRSRHYLDEKAIAAPLRWKRPRRIFLSSMTDVFGEWVSDELLDRLFAVMALTPHHTYQILTKRAERMRAYVAEHCPSLSRRTGGLNIPLSLAMTASNENRFSVAATWPLPNVWLGVSAEDQKRADERIPDLLATPAAVRFVSYEPALGPVDFYRFLHDSNCPAEDLDGDPFCICSAPREINLDWIIVGGESGPGARSFDITWARDVVEQCQGAGVAVFVKQLGAKPYEETRKVASVGVYPSARAARTFIDAPHFMRLKSRKGGDPSEWPADLRVREFPRNGSKQQ